MSGYVQMFVTNEFRPDPRLLKEARTLVGAGYQVQILAWDRERSGLPKRQHYDGVEVTRVHVPGGRYRAGLWQLLGYVLFYCVIICCLVKKRKRIAVIHAHEADVLPIAVVGRLLLRKPLIADFHELYSGRGWGLMTRLMGLVERWFLRFVDALIVVNEDQAHFYAPMLAQNTPLNVMPNYPEKRHLVFGERVPKPFTISFYGNVRNKPEIESLLIAAERVGNVRVLIAGHGADAHAVSEMVKQYPNASYLGPFTYSDLPMLYCQSDVVFAVFPLDRNTEGGYSTKMWEALACGQPAIVTAGSVAERLLLDHAAGYGVTGKDPNEIVDVIQRIRSDYESMSSRAANLGAQYVWEKLEPTLLELYQRVS